MSGMAFPGIVMLFLMLLFYGFIIYFLVSVLKFMKRKNHLDQERNRKLDKLLSFMENSFSKNNDH